jgi:hypothetical protein
MGLFMMLASATWGHAGVFTPFYRISGVLDRGAFDVSLEETAGGNRFWLDTQTVLPGACVHLALAALFGMLFYLLAREGRGSPAAALVAAAVGWSLLVAALMVPVLGVGGREGRGGGRIAQMPSQVGWATYVAMHLVYGLALGALVALVRHG